MSGFRAALDLIRYIQYPLSNLIRPWCAERAKPGQGKPVLIMHIGFFICFHTLSLEHQSFQQNRHINFHAPVALKLLVSLISSLIASLVPRLICGRRKNGLVSIVCASVEYSVYSADIF